MDIREYYNLPEGTNVSLRFTPSFYDTVDKYPYPCPSSMDYAFTYYKGTSIPELDTSNVTTMGNMFNYCQNFTSLDGIENWDTSKVTNMNSMFSYCRNLTSLDVSSWDTSKVTNMYSMFYYCRNLTSLDGIENWDTSKVNSMNSMFSYCEKLTSLDVSSWDTSKVTNMSDMFYYCEKLETLSSIRADSLSLSSYQSPFGSSTNKTLVNFGGFINLKSSWNGSYCLDKLTALSHQSLINILNGLYDFIGNGVTPTSSQGKIKFGSTHLANLSDDEKAIATNKGWTLS